jgi:type I restriction enzyme M protein
VVQQEFLDALRELGGSAGNGRLREALGWDEATYDGVRLALIDSGQIKPGRGRGGSVVLADGEGATDEDGASERPVKVKRSSREKAAKSGNGGDLGFEAELFKAADKLRGNLEPSEYKHVALGLIFLKYISEAFEAQYEKLQAEEYADPEDP